jgi:hypothetical protein
VLAYANIVDDEYDPDMLLKNMADKEERKKHVDTENDSIGWYKKITNIRPTR